MGYRKYNNRKVEYDGKQFDSIKERDRYVVLKLLLHNKSISNLRCQVPYELIPAQYEGGKCVERAVKYVADFVYTQHGKTVVEDTKGVRTQAYIIKRKLLLERHGIKIEEI